LLYVYFRDKNDLLHAITERSLLELRERLGLAYLPLFFLDLTAFSGGRMVGPVLPQSVVYRVSWPIFSSGESDCISDRISLSTTAGIASGTTATKNLFDSFRGD
ncbi:MAG: hypothetical protein HC856_01055, partial [Pseudanabaena sp. RU_4_16]|nr:hypothetical protein [Pseudanabaena sp. RU_4_16]